MNVGIIIIIIAAVIFLPLQMLLPFPFGLFAGLFIVIFGIVGAIVAARKFKRREKFAEESLKYQAEEEEPKKNEKSWDGI